MALKKGKENDDGKIWVASPWMSRVVLLHLHGASTS